MHEHRLKQIERRLLEMSAPFPEPTPEQARAGGLASLMGARARSLYGGFLHSLSGSSQPSTLIELRPLVELAILLKWYSIQPELHGILWNAQSEAADLRVIEESQQYLGVTNPSSIPDAELTRQRAAKRRVVSEARALLKKIGRDYGSRVAPGVGRMVAEIVEADPGHAIAVRQAYIVAYRNFSPWVHSEAASFKSTTRDISSTRAEFVGDRIPVSTMNLRLLGGAMLAYCIEVVSSLMPNPSRLAEARSLRDELVDADAYLARLSAE